MSRQMMFRSRYIKAFILAVAAVAAACTADPADPVSPDSDYDYDDEPASLTIDVSIADLGIDVSTRATGADTGTRADANTPTFSSALSPDITKYLNPDYSGPVPTADPELTYYNQAKSIDGSVMTCLTVILVHRKTNRIVGIRRIPDPDCPNKSGQDDPNNVNALFDEDGKVVEFDENGNLKGKAATHARITFDYENPYHVVTEAMVGNDDKYIGKSAERLVRGEYSIMVVANYDHNVTTSAADGEPTLNVDRTLENISDLFHDPQHMAEGIYPFASVPDRPDLPNYEYFYNLRFLMNRTLQRVGSDDGNNLNDVFKVVELPIDKDGNPIKDEVGEPIKPYIRPAVQQTLSVAEEFYLEASNNHLELELLRISSRTRVEVKNNSTTPLKVHMLKFSNNYTQSTIYLFRRNKNDRDYSELANKTMHGDHDGKGAPIVSYTGIVNPGLNATTYGAIVPFLHDWDSDNDNVVDGVKVEPGKKRCIFDALMYESNVNYKDDPKELDSFTYTIKVSYPEVGSYKTTDKNKIDTSGEKGVDWKEEADPERATFDYAIKDGDGYIQIPNGATVEDVYNSIKKIEQDYNGGYPCYFLIQCVQTNKFLHEKEDGTLCAERTDLTLATEGVDIKSFLWSLDGLEKDADGNYYCYLKNIRSEKHMPNIPQDAEVNPNPNYGGNPMKSTDDMTSQKYKLEVVPNTSEDNIAFSNTFPGSQYGTYYLNVWRDDTYLGGWHDRGVNGSQYRLYPIKLIMPTVYVGTPKPIEKTVTLTAFNDETAVVEDVHEIQRNDFVRILVEVSYNPDKSDFEFEVNSWVKNPDGTDKGGVVTFK